MNLEPRLLHLAQSKAFRLAATVALGLAAGLLAIAQARLLSQIIARVFLGGADLAGLGLAPAWFLAVIVLRAAAGFGADWVAGGLAQTIKTGLRRRLFAHMSHLGPVGLSEKPAGEAAATALQGVDSLEAYFSQFLPQVALAGLIPLGVLLFVFPLDPLSGAILLVTGPLIPFFMFLIGSNAEKLTARQFRALRRMSAELLDSLQGLKTLKALGRSAAQAGRIEVVSAAYRDTTLEVLRVTFLSALALELLGTISTAVIAVQVGLRLLHGNLGFEQAFFLLVIAPDFYLPLRTLGLRFHASMQGVSAARQIYSWLDRPGLVPAEPAAPAEIVPDWGQIDFRGVGYQYAGRETAALDGLTMRLRRGEMTALVGESGGGKSTAAAVLMRFLAPQAGQVMVGGSDLAGISVAAWREQTAWVAQRPHLFNATLAENLRIARENAGDDRLWQALEDARLADFARSLPRGLDTPLGENGARLSSGQAQRLALARAFLRQAPLLVMDEPTAHLDAGEADLIAAVLRRLCQGRTVLMIAHRLETVVQADQIVVLRGGRAVEWGRHDELLSAGGEFSRLAARAGGAI